VSPFAVVIVNYRSPELTARCIDAARADGPDEIVVVDNASGDGSPERIRERHPDVTVVERASNDGFATGVNAGLEATTAPVVVLLNPDALPRPGALRRLVEHLDANPRAGVAAPRLLYEDGTPQESAYRRAPNLLLLFVELCLPVGWFAMRLPRLDPYRVPPERWTPGARVAHVIGAALAVRRAAYDAAGPLDEGFFLYLEETEWQERVRRAGWTVELVPGAEVEHLVRGGGEESLAPSPHFLPSMRRYLALRGTPRALTEAAIAVAIALSRLAARADPRPDGPARAAAYDELWRQR
jgi:N-acetylglucosaminyl-diphospho-decaprenol L-rhamnosyltransferase